MTFSFKAEEICDILRASKESGVTSLQLGDFLWVSFEAKPAQDTQEMDQSPSLAQFTAPATQARERLEHDQNETIEEKLQLLAVTDPEAFEELLMAPGGINSGSDETEDSNGSE